MFSYLTVDINREFLFASSFIMKKYRCKFLKEMKFQFLTHACNSYSCAYDRLPIQKWVLFIKCLFNIIFKRR